MIRAAIGGVVLGASLLAWLPAVRDWDVRGLVAWALTIDVGLLYLTYVGLWTVTVHPGAWTTTLSGLLRGRSLKSVTHAGVTKRTIADADEYGRLLTEAFRLEIADAERLWARILARDAERAVG